MPSQTAADLLQAAHSDGQLSMPALQALQMVDVGATMNAALGTPALDIQATEVVLIALMPDDSGSIEVAGNTQVMRDGHNMVIGEFEHAKHRDGILLLTRLLNGEVINPFTLIEAAQRLTTSNYRPHMGTPLYDNTLVLLGDVLAKKQELEGAGIVVRTITLIITDGADLHSRKAGPNDVARVVKDMLLREGEHIVAGMGISDGRTDFRQVFTEMGIPDRWIYTPGDDPREIRRGFELFSQSAAQASQSAGSFSQAALGGFGGN